MEMWGQKVSTVNSCQVLESVHVFIAAVVVLKLSRNWMFKFSYIKMVTI